MSQAPQYLPVTSFSDDESAQAAGRSTVRTAAVDVELANISASINALVANLALLQRDDGKLRDLLLEPYMLGEAVRSMLTTAGVTLRGAWAANTQYALKDLVQRNGVALICQTPHNSGPSFNLGFWLAVSGDGQAQAYAEQAGASATAAATSATAAATSATTASTAATNAGNSATAAAASQLAAQNSANSIAGLAPVNLNAFMLDLLANVNAAGVRGDIDAASTTDLASTASATKGAGMLGYSGDRNYVALTIGARLLDIGASPRSLGATGDGVADDTAYIVAALLYSKTLDLRNRKWKITSTVSLPAGCVVDMRGGSIVAATGATPLFSFTGAKEGLAILGGGSSDPAGQVTGTCSDFLFCEGSTDTPTSAGQYARQIRIEGLHVTSPTITRLATFSKAARQVFMRGCMVFTANGISFSGKNVEVMIADSIIYGATGATGTYGIKTRSTGGTTYYNEGISVVNCTVDNFEITHDITDIFVYQVVGGYHGVAGALAATSGYVMQLQAPSTNLCEEIEVGGGAVFAGRSRFVGSASGVAYHAKIDVHNINTPGTAWALENNASDIDINVVAKNALGGGGVGIVGTSNNARITARGKFDSTYTNGIVLNGAAGADCVIGPVSGPTTGAIVGAARPVLLVGVPIHSASVASLVRTVSASNLAGSYAVGATIGTISWAFARGERGDIVVNLPYSGANASTQNIQISLPTGMVAESGSGWAATNLYVGAANGLLSVRIPYRCSQDGSGSISVVNQAGNTLTVTNQAYIGLFKDL